MTAKTAVTCGSCGADAAQAQLHTVRVAGYGEVSVCVDPVTCRLRATAAGTWCTYQPAGARR